MHDACHTDDGFTSADNGDLSWLAAERSRAAGHAGKSGSLLEHEHEHEHDDVAQRPCMVLVAQEGNASCDQAGASAEGREWRTGAADDAAWKHATHGGDATLGTPRLVVAGW